MSERGDKGGKANVRSLTQAIRKVRIAEADRSDVVVELRDAERARLDMLADELRDVFAEVPSEDEQFIFSVMPGAQPRLWIDQTAFVALARDKRTYRLLKDTRLGRTVILETADIDDMADTVTNYVAERIVERERAIEGDWLMKRVMREGEKQMARLPSFRIKAPEARSLGWVTSAFLFGVLAGMTVLLAYAWFKVPG
jgi:hypothetical protein